jgi:hypothetical protein
LGEPVSIAKRGQIEGTGTEAAQALLIQVVIVAVGNQHHLRGGKFLWRNGEGGMATEARPDISEDGIGEDNLTLEVNPEGGVSQVGDGIPTAANLLYLGVDYGKVRGMAFV